MERIDWSRFRGKRGGYGFAPSVRGTNTLIYKLYDNDKWEFVKSVVKDYRRIIYMNENEFADFIKTNGL